MGRPLAALLANDGARVFSADIDNIQEYNRRPRPRGRRPSASGSAESPAATQAARHLPHHVVRNCKLSLEECLAQSDTVITGVPSKGYKVKTEHLRDGVVAVNFSSEKNFESDIKDKVRVETSILPKFAESVLQASIYMPSIGKTTIAMLQRNLYVIDVR